MFYDAGRMNVENLDDLLADAETRLAKAREDVADIEAEVVELRARVAAYDRGHGRVRGPGE
jgi:hypothetical protein